MRPATQTLWLGVVLAACTSETSVTPDNETPLADSGGPDAAGPAVDAAGADPDAAAVIPDAAAVTPDAAEATDAAVVSPDAGPAEFLPPEARERIATAAGADLERTLATGVQVALWHAGELIYVGNFGARDPEGVQPVDAETVFQIGSDTKKMTAVLALQQVAAGRLTLDTTVAEALPGLSLAASPEWAAQATVHHLISHQGGLYDFTPWVENPDDASLAEVSRGEFAENVWAMSEPGAFWNYSNPNFSLAGYVTELAAGRPWPDLAEQDLFAPLGMEHTFARRAAAVATGNYATGTGIIVSADGMSASEPGPVDISHTVDNGFLRPAGLVWSTASDMARFGAFFVHGDPAVLPDDLREQTTEKQVLLYPAIDFQGYGYGWMVFDGFNVGQTYFAQPFWSHGGNTLSGTSLTWVLPELDLSLSILSNGYGDDFTATGIAVLEGTGLLPDEGSPPPMPSSVETDHARLVGTYADRQLGDVIVTDVAGVLTVSLPSSVRLGFTYTPELAFSGYTDVYLLTAAGQDFDLTFVADEAGTYEYIRNRSFVFRRSEETPVDPPVNPRFVPLAPAFSWAAQAPQRRHAEVERRRMNTTP
jgi:CubicO group peptidase (beta-lactamase class C family)